MSTLTDVRRPGIKRKFDTHFLCDHDQVLKPLGSHFTSKKRSNSMVLNVPSNYKMISGILQFSMFPLLKRGKESSLTKSLGFFQKAKATLLLKPESNHK